jgi:Skp family chaperone for outer membrane proteins
MKKEITLGNLLSVGVPILLIIIGWGISVNSRMEANDVQVENNTSTIVRNADKIEKVDDKVDQNFKEIQSKLDRIIERLGTK